MHVYCIKNKDTLNFIAFNIPKSHATLCIIGGEIGAGLRDTIGGEIGAPVIQKCSPAKTAEVTLEVEQASIYATLKLGCKK